MGLRVAFYGDDFTGSTDALFQFHRFGLRGKLFLSLPSAAALRAAADDYDVVGVAGIARALPTASIDAEIRPAFERFAELRCDLVQYKICSTFDSSPEVGSFGVPIALAREIFGAVALPVLPAQPEFGRYTLFANHFARAGQVTYRLDRHPTMSRHPSTPIDEADLCRFLERQIDGSVTTFDLATLRSRDGAALRDHLAQLRAARPAAIVFDAVNNDDLVRVARLLLDAPGRRPPIVALGSGGLSYGFGAAMTADAPRAPGPVTLPAVDKLLVVSGSCAPQTAEQIRWALEHGWRGVRVDPRALAIEARHGSNELIRLLCTQTIEGLCASERGVVVYSALGPEENASAREMSSAPVLGEALGRIVRHVFETTALRRAVVSGGDTSGYATQALGAESLEILMPLVPAGALCRLSSSQNPRVDDAEIMLKGGQVGNRELFEFVRTATASSGDSWSRPAGSLSADRPRPSETTAQFDV